MNTRIRAASVLISLVCAGATLSACGTTNTSHEQTFAYSGKSLNIVNDNAAMPVSVSRQSGDVKQGEEVKVTVSTRTSGKDSSTPAWSLSNDTLTLGTPCGDGYVGYCEGSFAILVPKGVNVTVNGKPASVG